jgi:hypothetical protein
LLPSIFERYPTAEGFLVMKEGVVFNYWHLASANKTLLWSLHAVCSLFLPLLFMKMF